MPKSRTATALLLVLLGFAGGLVAGAVLVPRPAGKRSFVVSRAGPQRLINPLLECDLADETLGRGELSSFREKVAAVIAARLRGRPDSSAAVYFRALNDGIWFSLGDTERFTPASLRKLPVMLALLKMADRPGGDAMLARTVPNTLTRDHNLGQNIKPSVTLEPGRAYSVKELIRRMIVYSDNNAFMLLTRVVDPAELARVYGLLRLEHPGEEQDTRYQSVQTVASSFRILYNATYVSPERSELALELLAQTEFTAGLVAGVPGDVVVAHKFGEKTDDPAGRVQLHDCGIVYHPVNPYVLCVMSRGTDFESLDELIAEVSRVVYAEVSAQLGASDRSRAVP